MNVVLAPQTSKKSAPIITVVQDSLTGAYLLTRKEQNINRKEFFTIF